MINTLTVKNKIFKSKNDILFYVLMAAFPIAQVILFYFVVNGNSILLAFRNYNGVTNTFSWSYTPMSEAFSLLTNEKAMYRRLVNSLIIYGIGFLIILPLSLFFSLYIYKKKKFSKFFRTMLFLPSVISPIILTILFGYFVDRAAPELMDKIFNAQVTGLLSDLNTQFGTVLFYNILIGFGVQMLMYSNAMSGINYSIVESAMLEGANTIKEFWYITLPSIWPTLVTFIVVGIAGIFTNQMNLIGFFGTDANVNVQTIGYYLFAKVTVATNMPGGIAEYPVLSAIGIYLTIIAVPLTLIIKYLLERFGPSED